ncbi:MAG: glycosyltransferase family 2 protein [Prevotella sp.]|nr:glycosyltransferase family 2 protein [Prevotella sp.]
MKLSVVIVNYNVRYYLEQCLDSVLKATKNIEAEVLVFDNYSKDGSVDYLKTRFPQVHFIESNHNLGFARGNNVAIRQSQGEYVLLLNPDTFVGEDVLADTLAFMEAHPKAGALGVRMLKNTGEPALESRRGLPSPMTAFYKMCGLCARFPKSRRFGRYYMGYLPWDKPAQIEVVSGAFCLLRRKVLDDVGLLDEDFFMYGEDIDLSYRVLKGGYENWYFPASIMHYKGESTQKSSFRYVHVFYDAMLIFFRKHYSHLNILITWPIRLAVLFKATMALFGMMVERGRKAVGLGARKHSHEPEYVFVGSRQACDDFSQLVKKKGLTARYIEGDSRSLPDGHHGQVELNNTRRFINIVYDTESYTYGQILELFSRQPKPHVQLGTFSRRNNIIITSEEILK